jgi:hypothetical protein
MCPIITSYYLVELLIRIDKIQKNNIHYERSLIYIESLKTYQRLITMNC